MNTAVDDLRVHAGARDVFADLVDDQDVNLRGRELGHPRFHLAQNLFFLRDHGGESLTSADGREPCGFMERPFLDGEAAENFAAGENTRANAANHFFEAQAVRIGVISLRAGEFAQTDRHHLKETAFEGAHEICVPLDAG